MLEQFLNHIRQYSLCDSNDRILLAVSGGLDSMTMLHLFKEAGFQIAVAHCNFQLRGAESDGDESFVRTTCKQLNIPFFSIRFDTDVYAKQNGLSTQMAARELRYAWFQKLLHDEKYDWLATAHHFNDSVETVLLNWLHGGSIESFAGIPVKNQQVIRPLLFALRSDLEKYATDKNLSWRDDASNVTDDYQRNFLRHQVIPKLKEINPSLESTLQYGLKKVKSDLSFLDASVGEWKQNHIKEAGLSIRIEKKALANLPVGITWRVLKPYGFNFSQCEDLTNALNGQSGKKFLSNSHQLTVDRKEIILTPLESSWEDILIKNDGGRVTLGSWDMDILTTTNLELTQNPLMAILDSDKLRFPLCWRKWKPGDYFYPLGMEHKRKLSDFLIDKKVSIAEKNYVTVLESEGQIVWVVGHRIDSRFRLTSSTKSAMVFSLQPHFG